jgi:hypothetical protein
MRSLKPGNADCYVARHSLSAGRTLSFDYQVIANYGEMSHKLSGSILLGH